MRPKTLADALIKLAYTLNYRDACQRVPRLIVSAKAVAELIVIGVISNMNMEIAKLPHVNTNLTWEIR